MAKSRKLMPKSHHSWWPFYTIVEGLIALVDGLINQDNGQVILIFILLSGPIYIAPKCHVILDGTIWHNGQYFQTFFPSVFSITIFKHICCQGDIPLHEIVLPHKLGIVERVRPQNLVVHHALGSGLRVRFYLLYGTYTWNAVSLAEGFLQRKSSKLCR